MWDTAKRFSINVIGELKREERDIDWVTVISEEKMARNFPN